MSDRCQYHQAVPDRQAFLRFVPAVTMNTTAAQASITSQTPGFQRALLEYGVIGSERDLAYESKRMSTASSLTIPSFPSPCHGVTSVSSMTQAPPTCGLSLSPGN